MKRLDSLLHRLGLMRVSRCPQISYDYQSGEIHVDLRMGWVNQIHGFVCPTPDGPLKMMTYGTTGFTSEVVNGGQLA